MRKLFKTVSAVVLTASLIACATGPSEESSSDEQIAQAQELLQAVDTAPEAATCVAETEVFAESDTLGVQPQQKGRPSFGGACATACEGMFTDPIARQACIRACLKAKRCGELAFCQWWEKWCMRLPYGARESCMLDRALFCNHID